MLGGRELAEGNAKVVGIVECVEKILICSVDGMLDLSNDAYVKTGEGWKRTEWMYILEPWKALEDCGKLLCECFLGIFDFSCIESCTVISIYVSMLNGVKLPRILLILNPDLICVGSRRWVRLKTTSRNSWLVGTGAISFHVVFMAKSRQGVPMYSQLW